MDGINLSLGRRLFALRNAKGFSQDKLAEMAGMSVKHLGKIERGVANASIKCLSDIANALDISVSDMLEVEHEQDIAVLQAKLAIAIPKLALRETQIVYRLVQVLSEF